MDSENSKLFTKQSGSTQKLLKHNKYVFFEKDLHDIIDLNIKRYCFLQEYIIYLENSPEQLEQPTQNIIQIVQFGNSEKAMQFMSHNHKCFGLQRINDQYFISFGVDKAVLPNNGDDQGNVSLLRTSQAKKQKDECSFNAKLWAIDNILKKYEDFTTNKQNPEEDQGIPCLQIECIEEFDLQINATDDKISLFYDFIISSDKSAIACIFNKTEILVFLKQQNQKLSKSIDENDDDDSPSFKQNIQQSNKIQFKKCEQNIESPEAIKRMYFNSSHNVNLNLNNNENVKEPFLNVYYLCENNKLFGVNVSAKGSLSKRKLISQSLLNAMACHDYFSNSIFYVQNDLGVVQSNNLVETQSFKFGIDNTTSSIQGQPQQKPDFSDHIQVMKSHYMLFCSLVGSHSNSNNNQNSSSINIENILKLKHQMAPLATQNRLVILRVYDFINQITVYEEKGGEVLAVQQTETGFLVLRNSFGKMKQFLKLTELDIEEKMNVFLMHKEFGVAKRYLKTQYGNAMLQAQVSRIQAQFFFDKGLFDKSIKHFKRTIGYLDPVHVISLFGTNMALFSNLLDYLEELRTKGFASKDNISQLMNGYVFESNFEKLKKCLANEKAFEYDEKSFDAVQAIKVCCRNNQFELGLTISNKYKYYYLSLEILIDNYTEYSKAIYYIRYTLPIREKIKYFNIFGTILFDNNPDECMQLFFKIHELYLLKQIDLELFSKDEDVSGNPFLQGISKFFNTPITNVKELTKLLKSIPEFENHVDFLVYFATSPSHLELYIQFILESEIQIPKDIAKYIKSSESAIKEKIKYFVTSIIHVYLLQISKFKQTMPFQSTMNIISKQKQQQQVLQHQKQQNDSPSLDVTVDQQAQAQSQEKINQFQFQQVEEEKNIQQQAQLDITQQSITKQQQLSLKKLTREMSQLTTGTIDEGAEAVMQHELYNMPHIHILEQKIIVLLKQFLECIDKHGMLAIFKSLNFPQGIIFLLENLKQYEQLLYYHISDGNLEAMYETCVQHYKEEPYIMFIGVKHLVSLLSQVNETNESFQNEVQMYLNRILSQNEDNDDLTSIQILQLMTETQKQVPFKVVRQYFANTLNSDISKIKDLQETVLKTQQHINLLKNDYYMIKTQAKIFQTTRCENCQNNLSNPIVHFMCGHSFHEKCCGEVRIGGAKYGNNSNQSQKGWKECTLCSFEFQEKEEMLHNINANFGNFLHQYKNITKQ